MIKFFLLAVYCILLYFLGGVEKSIGVIFQEVLFGIVTVFGFAVFLVITNLGSTKRLFGCQN